MRLDLRDLIGEPFWPCPKCGLEEFGVLSVYGHSYVRRCRQCRYSEGYPLKPLRKKVLYLDQFVISKMMKALDSESPGHERAKADPFWLDLYEALERVCRLQLAICPDSEMHQHESLLSPFYEPLKLMYERFSRGISFDNHGHISCSQIAVAAEAWLDGNQPVYDFRPERATSREINDWHDRIYITVRMRWPTDVVDGIRHFRESVHEGHTKYCEARQQSSEKSFEFWYLHERDNGGKNGILGALQHYLQSLRSLDVPDIGRIYDSAGMDRYRLIREVFTRRGVLKEERGAKLMAFLDSDHFRDYPTASIETRLWAVLAQQFANGRKKPIDQGTGTDISAVSSLLPFCDAMFIDDGCRALLTSIPKEFALPYETQVFSTKTRGEFLDYVRQIEADADPELLREVHDVYGGDPSPYLTLYEDNRRRERDRATRQ